MSCNDEPGKAAFYREEAEGCRAIARLIAVPAVVTILLALAEDFEWSATRVPAADGRGRD
jgi:hypothetical protein